MLGAARLGDMFDKKKLYMAGIVLFTLGSLLCGLSPSVGWLIGFRALQGLGATLMQALGSAMVTEIVLPSERGRALGLMGSTVSVGIAVGPPLGGLLIGLIGWQSIFWVNVPVGIATWLIISRFVPASKIGRPGQRFDSAGALILFAAMGMYALGMTRGQDQGFATPMVLGMLAAAVLGLALFVLVEKRVQQPMVDLSMFSNRLFSTNLLMAFLLFIVMSGGFILPFFLQNVMGYSTQMVGFFLMSTPIVMGLIAPIAGTLSDKFGSRVISLAGLIMVLIGCLAIGSLHTGVTPLGIILRLMPLGIGMGLFQSPNNSAIMGAVPRERLGVASGLMGLSRTLGNTTGLPLIGSIFTALVLSAGGLPHGSEVTGAPAAALVRGISGTYHIAIAFIAASIVLAIFAWRADRTKKETKPALETPEIILD
jgi:EmrB/QacA subfamily drug resistance transporter